MKKIFVLMYLLLCFCLSIAPVAVAEEVAVPHTIDLTPLFQAVLVLLAAVITYRVVPWVKARTSEQQQRNLLAVVNTLVYGAEQIFGAGKGAEKLAYVTDALKAAGYNVDSKEVLATVEAMVKKMKEDAPRHLWGEVSSSAVSDETTDGEQVINASYYGAN